MIRILFLAANPDNADTLLAGDELRQIEAALKHTPFQVIAKPAAHLADLRSLLREHKPQIVHFSGHGSRYGELLFVDEQGQSQPAPAQALTNLFKLFNQQVRCVILNACYSADQAAAIGAVIDCVLSFEGAILDSAARTFAATFYSALAAGDTLAVAKEHGLNEIELRLSGALQPCHVNGRSDAAAIRPLNWDDEAPLATRKIFGLYPFNEHFFGREDELTELHSLLQAQAPVSICPVITGMGGLGKTQLAAHYARGHVADYLDGIFWITAANLNEIRPQLADFCVALGLPVADPQRSGDLTEQKITAFKQYLDQHPHALLIFDNVEEPDHLRTRQIGVQITALTLGGKVIITTRRRKLPGDRFAELPLQRLLPAPARQILTTARPDLAGDPDLDRLCDQFGYLPLMLNLAAAALKKRGGAIAGYLQRLQTLGAEKLHSEIAKVSLDDYHQSLTAVLHEQWAMLRDENARLLLRVAGQLPEAAVIPTARLGLLAGLQDVDEWERPLSDALEELETASLIERVDGATLRLHPLVGEFATTLTPPSERAAFRTACAQKMADAYTLEKESGLRRLGQEYATRGITALLMDLITALELLRLTNDVGSQSIATIQDKLATHHSQLATDLQSLLRLLRLEAHHLQGPAPSWQMERLWQQLLPRTPLVTPVGLTPHLANLLRHTLHWLPQWGHQRQSLAVEQTLSGHKASVRAVALLDTNRIVSASDDYTLKVWNLTTGAVEQTLSGHKASVRSVALLDTNRIVSASDDHTLKVWNLTTGTVEQTLNGHEDWVNSVAVLDTNRIVSKIGYLTWKVWNLATSQVEQTFTSNEGSLVSSVTVQDGQHIVFPFYSGTLKVWNLQTGVVDQVLTDHEDRILNVAVLDRQRIVSASDDNTLKVWNLQTGVIDQVLTDYVDDGPSYGIDYDIREVLLAAVLHGQGIVSASDDDTLKVWNLQTGVVEQRLTGHEGTINAVAVVDGWRIVSASADRTLKVWNLQTGAVEQRLTGHKASVLSVAVVNGQRIVSASADRTLKVWNLTTGQLEQTLIGHNDLVSSLTKLDDQRVVTAVAAGKIKIWNLTTGRIEQILTGHDSKINAVALLDCQRVVSTSDDRTLKVWNLATGQVEQTLSGHKGSVNGVVVLDANRIVSASADRTLKVWNLNTSQVERTLSGHEGIVWSVAVVDGQRVVSASADRTLKVWNFATGQIEQTLSGHEARVLDVAVVDSQRIVSASDDRTLKVWNLTTSQMIASIGLDGAPQCVAVTRQGDRTLVVAGDAAGALYCLELVEPR